jgi:nicotinate-nucleotide--dimethylbenzimidazole phosphoribosyltransferase
MKLKEISQKITGLYPEAVQAAQDLQDSLVKPAGSLGALESIGIQIAGITGKVKSNVKKRVHFVFGADNGVYEEGVAAAPQYFTNFLMRGYASGKKCGINVLCEYNHVDLRLVDVGVIGEMDYKNIYNKRLMPNGTNNFYKEKAMSREIALQAIEVGFEFAITAGNEGYEIMGAGEVGMGNTSTAAACIMAALEIKDIEKAVGRGAGLSDEAFENKKRVIAGALAMHQPDPDDILDILSKVGGLDIAAMTGMFIGAAYYRKPIVIDGVISIAAALLAYKFNLLTKDFMIPSHVSEEPAYRLAAEAMGLKPILNLGMRLGEGTGCPIAMDIVGNAMAIINNMSTFEEVNMDIEYRKGLKA